MSRFKMRKRRRYCSQEKSKGVDPFFEKGKIEKWGHSPGKERLEAVEPNLVPIRGKKGGGCVGEFMCIG